MASTGGVRRGFTLLELLIVVAIIALLAGILFPVFRNARTQANLAVAAHNARSVSLGLQTYMGDWENHAPVTRYRIGEAANPRDDRTWVQLVLLYVEDLSVFFEANDPNGPPTFDGVFDDDLVPGDTLERVYAASQRSNLGLNHAFLSPIVQTSDGRWISRPRSGSQIERASETVAMAGSVWELVDGEPRGGGNFMVLAPCRFVRTDSGAVADAAPRELIGEGAEIYRGSARWTWNGVAPIETGNVYAWHNAGVTTAYVDGHVAFEPMDRLVQGCSPGRDWLGVAEEPGVYLWDLG